MKLDSQTINNEMAAKKKSSKKLVKRGNTSSSKKKPIVRPTKRTSNKQSSSRRKVQVSKFQDYIDLYDGYDSKTVGIGGIDPNIYYSKRYAKKKQQKILIGALQRIVYSGYEHDVEPLIIPMAYESAYNTMLCYNLHYIPIKFRKAMIKLILQQNQARIKKNQPLFIDYYYLKRVFPVSTLIVRRYKVVGIRVVDRYRLNEWDSVLNEPSKWSMHYKTKASAKLSKVGL